MKKMHRAIWQSMFLALLLASIGSLGWTSVAEAQLPARLFVTANYTVIQLGSGGPANWVVNCEPINNSFQLTDMNVDTVRLISPGTGDVSEIELSQKVLYVGDLDLNGIQDARFVFAKADLQQLFSNFHGNKLRTVNLTVQGNLYSGGSFSGQITIQVDPH